MLIIHCLTNLEASHLLPVLVQSIHDLVILPCFKLPFELHLSFTDCARTGNHSLCSIYLSRANGMLGQCALIKTSLGAGSSSLRLQGFMWLRTQFQLSPIICFKYLVIQILVLRNDLYVTLSKLLVVKSLSIKLRNIYFTKKNRFRYFV